ncbi:hypothetical protein FZEAL_9509 [Fusarium zealandicum]|uniref:Ubiquitin smt3 n=1 Tax=Fusarium zealandicum TaxID=1053134 RepID=A0A8H4UAV4_9HYPO|nr:hypothetical protein FZEAL_9509 [Fusarium zealandicum]
MSEDADASTSINKLSINTTKEPTKPTKPTTKKKAKKAVADSWEDEDLSGSEPEDDSGSDKPEELTPSATPAPPPPTPMSPVGGASWTPPDGSPGPRGGADPNRRPEKTDAVARRMIAAGLGLKAPKQTEEQRAYQRSVREQEKKRREQEKADEQRRREEAEKAKASVWDD